MNKKTLFLTGAACVFAFNAQTLDIKPLVGLDYVYSQANYENSETEDLLAKSFNSYSVSAGLKFNNYIGAEAFYQQSADEDKNILGNALKTTTSFNAYGLDVIGYVPLNPQFNLLASAGLAQYDVDIKEKVLGYADTSSDDGLGYRFGLGAQYNLNEHVGFRTMARYVVSDIDGLNGIYEVSAGLRYTF